MMMLSWHFLQQEQPAFEAGVSVCLWIAGK
jgi:hypothetical protein